MARIPRYQQDQLASSMVGTPGVDNATSAVLQTGSNAAETVGKAIYSVGEAEYQQAQVELHQKLAEQRAAQKELDNLHYETNAAATGAEADVALNDLSNTKRQAYQWKTDGALADWNEASQKIIQDKLDGITDPKQKLMTQKLLQQRLSSQTQQFSDYLNARIPEIGKANAEKMGDALRINVGNAPTADDAVKQLAQFEQDPANQKAFYNVHGPAAAAEMRKYQSDAARNYMSEVANTGDINAVTALINDKRFDKYIEGSDKNTFYTRQKEIATQQEQAQRHQAILDSRGADNQTISDLGGASPTGRLEDAPPAEIQKALQNPKLSPGMRERLTTINPKAEVKTTQQGNDGVVLQKMGAYTTYANQLHDQVLTDYANWGKVHGKAKEAALAKLQDSLDRYDKVHETVLQLGKSLKSDAAIQAVQSYHLKTKDEYDQLRSHLINAPQAQQLLSRKNAFRNQVGPSGTIYSIPQQQRAYDFYYTSKLDEVFRTAEQKGLTTKILGNQKALQSVRNQVRQYATYQAEHLGFTTRGQ